MDRHSLPIIKDRKVLRRIDAAAARRSVAGLVAAILVFVLLASWGGLYREHETLTLVYGLTIIAVTAFRLWIVARFDALHGAGPARWRRLYGLGLLLHSSTWGTLLATLVVFYGIHQSFLVAALYVLGVTTALASAWMSALRVRLMYAVLMVLPSAGALLYQGALDTAVLAVLLLIYLSYLIRLYKEQYLAFWHAFNRERRPVAQPRQVQTAQPNVQLSLVYRLAHEIRTPMNSIMGMLSMLRDTPLDEAQQEYRKLASQSGKLLLTMIDDVLDYSRVLTGRITLNPEFFDIYKAMEEVLDAYGPAAQSKGLELNAVIDHNMPARLHGDRDRLLQISSNLISNAIKFSESGEIVVHAAYNGASVETGLLELSISDQGAGMDAETVDTLFMDSALADEDMFAARRTGFGLLVCRGLAEAMGGRISVESVLGEGSTFTVSLPMEERSGMAGKDSLKAAAQGRTAVVAGAARGTVDSLSEELLSLDMDVSATSDYDHALQVLRESHREHCDVPLLVVDTRERTRSAFDLVRTVLADPALAQVHVMVLVSVSERSDSKLEQLLRDQVRVEVLVKPVHRRQVRAAMQRSFGLESSEPVADRREGAGDQRERRKTFRLLLVEDNEVNQIVTRGMLDRLGYQVKTVGSGIKALELLRRERFDLVLMDCMMPEKDGFQTTRELRAYEHENALGRTPVVAMTANTIDGAQARCLAAGMDDYLPKPVHLDDMENMLNHWLPFSDEGDGAEFIE
ncbi:MAG: response regulator [Alcanivoracaceae bacterium]|nr:response regulator [Alcanivoracaceae bacterium]